jgi:phospholipase A2
MDAGMSNNLPIYPLLRPGRDVDILIAFDASADIKTENWLSVVDGYARQRGIKGWPIGAGWPKADSAEDTTVKELDVAAHHLKKPPSILRMREDQRETHNRTQQAVKTGKYTNPTDSDLGYCTVWVGTTAERASSEEPPHSKRVDSDFELMAPDAGIAVVYFPFFQTRKSRELTQTHPISCQHGTSYTRPRR